MRTGIVNGKLHITSKNWNSWCVCDYEFCNKPELIEVEVEDIEDIKGGLSRVNLGAFSNNPNLEKVIIRNVDLIGKYAFANCRKLRYIECDNVKHIEEGAFSECENVEEIILRNSPWVESSTKEANAFEDCTNIRSLTLINSQSPCINFSRYDSLTQISVQGKCRIQPYAFTGCTGIKELFIPSDCKISSAAFAECENLEHVIISDNCKIYESAFESCPSLTKIEMGKNCTLDERVFAYCHLLEKITIGENCNLGDVCFGGCSKLSSIEFPKHCTISGAAVFADTAWYKSQPNGLIYLNGGTTLYGYKGATSKNIIIDDKVLDICPKAFFECSSVESIHIPEGITEIKDRTFTKCNNLKYVYYPNSLNKIGEAAFAKCPNLAYFLPQSQEPITPLVYFKNSIRIGELAFYECTSIEEISFNADDLKKGIIKGIFSQNKTGNHFTINDGAFAECENLYNVTPKVSFWHNDFSLGKGVFFNTPYKPTHDYNLESQTFEKFGSIANGIFSFINEEGVKSQERIIKKIEDAEKEADYIINHSELYSPDQVEKAKQFKKNLEEREN